MKFRLIVEVDVTPFRCEEGDVASYLEDALAAAEVFVVADGVQPFSEAALRAMRGTLTVDHWDVVDVERVQS